MEDQKPWWTSAGVWGSVVAILLGIASGFGIQFDASVSDQLTQLLTSAGTLVTGIIALVGRIRATKQITPTITGKPKP